jgi:hypothetical protein
MLAIAALVVAAAPALAHEHKVMGTIKAAAADHLTIKTTDGKDATITIANTTTVTRDKVPIKAGSLTPGTRVVVTTASDESPYVAMSVQAGPAAPEPAPKKK